METAHRDQPRITTTNNDYRFITMNLDMEKLHALLGNMVGDMGAAASAALVVLGDNLGLFAAVTKAGPASSTAIAAEAGIDERYIREWLSCMAASGYVEYDAAAETFSMLPEQAAVFAIPDSPAILTGGFQSVASLFVDEPKVRDAFSSGKGLAWGDHSSCLFCGVERFFRPGYEANLVNGWIPALSNGVREKLEAGARVADVGCGHGCSTAIMAKAFPNSQFIGYDVHEPSLVAAREIAAKDGLTNITFEQASAKDYPGNDYDMVAFFDCLHDMGDPEGAAAHVRETLKDDGTWMMVEPMAGDSLAENLNPVSRLYYAFSTMICVPASKDQEVGLALGAQAGEKRIGEVVKAGGGFSQFRRAAETPFNIILEARI